MTARRACYLAAEGRRIFERERQKGEDNGTEDSGPSDGS
jgi:hypothetical protein